MTAYACPILGNKTIKYNFIYLINVYRKISCHQTVWGWRFDSVFRYVFRKLDSDGSIKQLMLPRAKHFYVIQPLKHKALLLIGLR